MKFLSLIRCVPKPSPVPLGQVSSTDRTRCISRKDPLPSIWEPARGPWRNCAETNLAMSVRSDVRPVAAAMPRLGHKNLDDALAAVGKGEPARAAVLRAMGLSINDQQLKEMRRKSTPKKGEISDELSIPVRGVARNTALRISPASRSASDSLE